MQNPVLSNTAFSLVVDINGTQAAATFAAEAQASAAAASSSATTATTEAGIATTQAGNSAASATGSAASAAAALASQNAASASAASAATSATALTTGLASFNKTWLGPHTSDPTLDNQGNALVIGAEYLNTSVTPNIIRVYTSSGWQDQDATAESASANAALSATQAANSAGAASASATAASNSASAAASSASGAAGSATSAANSATAAANSTAAATGELSLNLAGATGTQALTAAQAMNAIWKLTGALSGNVILQIPNSGVLPHNFSVQNGTTGTFTVTIAVQGQAPNSSVVQGTSPILFTDATGVYATSSVTGVQFAKQTLLSGAGTTTLDITYLGSIVYITAASQIVKLPLAATYPAGSGVAVKQIAAGTTGTIQTQGSDSTGGLLPYTTVQGDTFYFVSDGNTTWHVGWYSNKTQPSYVTSVAAPLVLAGAGAATNGTDAVVAAGSIGATGTGGILRLIGAATAGIAQLLSTALGLSIVTTGANPITFNPNGTERGRFSGAGNLLIGTTTDNATDQVQVAGSVNAETSLKTPLVLVNGATVAQDSTDVIVADGSIGSVGTGGILRFVGAATAGIASIVSTALGLQITATGANPIEFLTNAVERMRISVGGKLLINTTTDDGVNYLQVNGGVKSSAGGFTFPDGTTQTTANGVTAPTSSVFTNGSGFAPGATSITTSGYTAPFVNVYRNGDKLTLNTHYTLPGDSVTIAGLEPLGAQDFIEVLTGVIYSPSTVYAPADQAFTPLAGATGITYAHTVGFCLLFCNGDKLIPTVDYTETSAGFTFVNFTADGLETYEVWNLTPVTIANTLPLSGGTLTGLVTASSQGIAFNDGSVQGTAQSRNRLINGGVGIDQRNSGASQTITAAAALAYTVDRFYAYCTGANVTGQRVAGSGTAQYVYQFTGAASVTGIGFGQRIEAANCYDMNGQTATLSVELANSLLTTVTWTAYYANTADTFGTLASPTRTQIATGTFTVNATRTKYSAQIAVPAAATTGIEVVLSVGAQTSGTWTIGNVQLERGSAAGAFERRLVGEVLAMCQRYAFAAPQVSPGFVYSTTVALVTLQVPVTMRATPTLNLAGTAQLFGASGGGINCSANSITSIQGNTIRLDPTVASGLVAGNATAWACPSGSIFSAEL